MSIDVELRSRGIGGSEIAAICGLDHRRDAFAVWADKMGRVKRAEPTTRMKWGKRVERVIAEAYGEETRQEVRWFDQTISHPTRTWQVMTPDAFVWKGDVITSGVDAKNVSYDQAQDWGDPGSDILPNSISLQCHWYCSGTTQPIWDVAGLFGGNDLRVYRVHYDKEIEAVLLDEAEQFWKKHVLAKVAPAPTGSTAAGEALKSMFPKNVENMRPATAEELPLIEVLRVAKVEYKRAESAKDQAENQIKLAIGDAEGLTVGGEKITWKKEKDSMGVDWEAVARCLSVERVLLIAAVAGNLGAVSACKSEGVEFKELEVLAADHRIVTRQGARKLLVPRGWTKE